MATPGTPTPVLELSTLVERPFITIDGARYDIKHPEEFSLVGQLQLTRQAERVLQLVELMVTRKHTEDDEKEYTSLVDQGCRQVLLAPDDIHAKLRDEHRVQIVRAFTTLLFEITRQRTGAKDATDATTTGNPPSLASVASTAGTPSGG